MTNFVAPEVSLQDADAWLQQIIDDLEKIESTGGAMPIESIELCETFLKYGVPIGELNERQKKQISARAMTIIHRLGQIGHNERSPLVIGFIELVNKINTDQLESIHDSTQKTRDRVQMYLNYANVFWDGICHSILPHMKDREEKEGVGWKEDEFGDSLKEAIVALICNGQMPESKYLGDRRSEDLRNALKEIRIKLQNPLFFDPKITQKALQKINEFLKILK